MADVYDDPTKLERDADAVTGRVVNRFERSRKRVESRAGLRADWYAAYRSYLKVGPDNPWPFRTRTFVPITFSHLEAHKPRLAAARPRIEVWGRGREDETRAAGHRGLCFFYWDLNRMDMRLIDLATVALTFGTAWWKVGYRRAVRNRKVWQMVPQEVPRTLFQMEVPWLSRTVEVPQLVPVATRVYDGPTVELVDPDDLFYDDDGYSVDTAAYIIHRTVTQLQDLRDAVRPDGQPLYGKERLDELEELARAGGLKERPTTADRGVRYRALLQDTQEPQPDPHKRELTLLEEWSDEKVTTVVWEAPQLPPIRHEFHDLGMKPFCRYTPIPLANEMEGQSLVEQLSGVQYSSNLLNAGMFDHLMQSVHAMHTVRRATGLRQKEIRFRPGGIIPVRDHDDVRPLETARLDFTHYREMDFLRYLAQEVSGASDIYRGVGGPAGDTATESSILAQAAASRVGLMFQILGAQTLHRLGKLWIRMSELYLDQERTLRVLGDEFADTGGTIRISPQDLMGGSEEELDLLIDIAQTEPATRQFRMQRAQTALQNLGNQVPPGSPVHNKIMEGLLEGMGVERPQVVLQQQAEWIARQQQAAAAAEAEAAGNGGPPDGGIPAELAVNASADAGRGDQL